MINSILKLFVPAIAVMLAGHFLDGVTVQSFQIAIAVAIVLALLNMFVKPILKLLTIPITFLTLGLFLIVLDAFMIILADKAIESGFDVENLGWAIICSLFISITSTFLNYFLD